MNEWIKISLILCAFGFFREMRPSEPFVTEFLSNGVWRNVTADQVNRQIYPFGTYSYLVQLCIVFLITDILRYKPIIVASACVGLVLWSLLLWTSSLEALYGVQICFGFFMASEVAYYTYIYAKVEKNKYNRVTGYTRASLLSGRFLAGVLAQILISFKLMNVRELNYISLGAQGVSLIVSMFLPAVGISLYMWTVDESSDTESNKSETKIKPRFSWKRATKLLWEHFISSYSNRTVVVWSLWWILSTAGYLMIINYVQLLWLEIQPDNGYNGAVEALVTMCGAVAAFTAGYVLEKSFETYDLYLLTICVFLEGILVIVSSQTETILIAYVMYILFGLIYNFLITLVTANVARLLSDDSFALIFGINTLISLLIQTLFTVIVVTETASFTFTARQQFFTFGSYFIVLGLLYLVASIFKCCKRRRRIVR